jgi:hypothetical protein
MMSVTAFRGELMDDSNPDSNKGISTGMIFIWSTVAYFTFFGIIWIDEIVLETKWISHHLPKQGEYAIRAVYYPILKVLDPDFNLSAP